MHLSLQDSGWLVVAASLLAVTAVALFLGRRHSLGWRIICLALPLGAAILIASSMAGLQFTWEPAAKRIVILIDRSGSARGVPWEGDNGPERIRMLCEKRLQKGTTVDLIGFGDRTGILGLGLRVGETQRWPIRWEGGELGPGSNADAALRWQASPEDQAPRWIITDGLIVSAEKVAQPLGLTVQTPRQVDLGIRQMRIENGEVWVEITATGKANGQVEIKSDDQLLARQGVQFDKAGGKWVAVPVKSELTQKQPLTFQANVRDTSGKDLWSENNVGSIRWIPELATQIRVLHVGGETPWNFPGAEVKRVGVERMGTAAEWIREGWQVVLLDDVPAADLGSGRAILSVDDAAALEEFVRQNGGGLAIRGTKHAFGPGGYGEGTGKQGSAASRIEKLSAVWSRDPERGAEVVIVVDGSASMNEGIGSGGEKKFMRVSAAVVSAVDELSPQDHITVIVFGENEARVAARGKVGEVKNELAKNLAATKPAGGTAPDVTLADVRGAMQSEANKKVVVFLTDGEIPAMDVEVWGKLVKEGRATMAVVAPRNESGGVVENLVKATGARWMGFADAAEWRGLLSRAVREPLVGKAESTAVKWATVNDARGEAELSGVGRNWVEVWKKEEATLRVAGTKEGGENVALAAVAQRGLGKVASVAVEDAGLLERMVREVAGESGDRRFVVKADRAGETWRVRVEGKDASGFLNGEKVWMRVDGRDERLMQIGPGVYEARLTAKGADVGVVTREDGADRKLVGLVRMADGAVGEWPASVGEVELPAGAARISGDLDVEEKWLPREEGGSLGLRVPLVILGILMALGALWGRRVRG